MFERQDSAQGATHTAAAQNRGRRRPPAKGRIRILIVDDHTVVRHGLRQVLEREPDMDIIGEAGTGLDAVRMAEGERPDVVLLDAKLGDDDGADVCRRVLAVSPATAVVVLTAYSQDGIILGALAAGAKGYLIKDVELDEIKRTVRAVYAGHSVLDPKVASRVIANVRTANGKAVSPGAAVLSERDLVIVRCVAAGLTNKAIAARVHLSPHTIKDRLEKIAAGFGVRSRTEIVAEAIRAGLV